MKAPSRWFKNPPFSSGILFLGARSVSSSTWTRWAPLACSFALGVGWGTVALKAPESRAALPPSRAVSAATLPVESALCATCGLLGGADRGSAPAPEARSLEVNLGAVLAPFRSPFQVADLTQIPAAQLPAGTHFWDPSQPLPGTFNAATVDPLFRTSYYDPAQGLLNVPSAPWNLFTPAGAPPLFGGAPFRLTGFQEHPLVEWVTSVGG